MASRLTPIRLALLESGRSQKWLAGELGFYESSVSRIVNGLHVPSEDTKRAIAEALGRPVTDLFPEGHGTEVSAVIDPPHASRGNNLEKAA